MMITNCKNIRGTFSIAKLASHCPLLLFLFASCTYQYCCYNRNNDIIHEINAWIIPTNMVSRVPYIQRSNILFSTRSPDDNILSSKSVVTDDDNIQTTSTSIEVLEQRIVQLKRVLEREYITFFNPMEYDYYSQNVTFIDPLTTLNGIQQYDTNVQMLSGRTILGSILFRDARILLHTITGGNIITTKKNNVDVVTISNIITRWTLKFTFQILPWNPTPCFTGISNYTIQINHNSKYGIQIIQQQDYWDSINLLPGGSIYDTVSKSIAIQHFISLLLPSSKLQANTAGPELPYTVLRIGKEYEVRRYPSYIGIQMIYERRDEAFITLGSYTEGLNPMAPAIIQVDSTNSKNVIKTMTWPIYYAKPGDTDISLIHQQETIQKQISVLQKKNDESNNIISTIIVPERVVAIRTFNDMIVEPLVRKVDTVLRDSLRRDGLLIIAKSSSVQDDDNTTILTFAQYDAIYSMGERRCEVHVPLLHHPW